MVEKAFNAFNHSKLMTDQEDKAWRRKNLKQINLEYDPRLQYQSSSCITNPPPGIKLTFEHDEVSLLADDEVVLNILSDKESK